MRKGLHKKTQGQIAQCLEWIVNYMLDNGYPPSYFEIANGMNISISTTHAWIRELSGRKKIEMGGAGNSRTMRIRGIYYIDKRGEL